MLCWKPGEPLPPSFSCHTCSCGGKLPRPPSGLLSPCCCQTCPRSFRCCFWPPLTCHWQTWTQMHSSSLALEVSLQVTTPWLPVDSARQTLHNWAHVMAADKIASCIRMISDTCSQGCTDLQRLVKCLDHTDTVSHTAVMHAWLMRHCTTLPEFCTDVWKLSMLWRDFSVSH